MWKFVTFPQPKISFYAIFGNYVNYTNGNVHNKCTFLQVLKNEETNIFIDSLDEGIFNRHNIITNGAKTNCCGYNTVVYTGIRDKRGNGTNIDIQPYCTVYTFSSDTGHTCLYFSVNFRDL